MNDQALALLHRLIVVEDWILAGDKRGQPYLDAGAAILYEGRVQFRPDIFDQVEMNIDRTGDN